MCDLHVVDVAAVPDRLENGVVKTKNQDVLHRLFAEIVIDAVNLVLRENCLDLAVQGPGRIVVIAKGLLDDHAAPVAVLLAGETDAAQLLHNGRKEFWGSR